jgi:hypothetical protein
MIYEGCFPTWQSSLEDAWAMIKSLIYTSGESLSLHLQKDFVSLVRSEITKSNQDNSNERMSLS